MSTLRFDAPMEDLARSLDAIKAIEGVSDAAITDGEDTFGFVTVTYDGIEAKPLAVQINALVTGKA